MLVTEREARELWCYETFNAQRAKCAASSCMAWRWAENIPQVCTKCGSEETSWEDRPEERKGFCGLAGMPKW